MEDKRKIQQACETCIKRHRKCDGGNPCSRCMKMKKECIYSEQRKRGPKPKKNSNTEKGLALILEGSPVNDVHYLTRTIHDDFLDSPIIQHFYEGMCHFSVFGLPTREEVRINQQKQFWLSSIMVNAFSLAKNLPQALIFASEVENFLNQYSFKYSGFSPEMALGILLLSNFRENNGENEKASSHIHLNYQLANLYLTNQSTNIKLIGNQNEDKSQSKIVSVVGFKENPLKNKEVAARCIFALNLNFMIQFAVEEDDIEFYYQKALRHMHHPREIFMMKTRYAIKVPDPHKALQITYELEGMLNEVAQSFTEFEQKHGFSIPNLCFIKSIRCSCYMKMNDKENALREAREAWNLISDMHMKHSKIFAVLSRISAVGIYCEDVELVSSVYLYMQKFHGMTEYFTDRVEEVATFLQNQIEPLSNNPLQITNISTEDNQEIDTNNLVDGIYDTEPKGELLLDDDDSLLQFLNSTSVPTADQYLLDSNIVIL